MTNSIYLTVNNHCDNVFFLERKGFYFTFCILLFGCTAPFNILTKQGLFSRVAKETPMFFSPADPRVNALATQQTL
jgi:hypothetical protein